MKRKLSLSALFFLGALPLGAMAAESAPPATGNPPAKQAPAAPAAKEQTPPLFEQLDANHDGYVTMEEAKRSAEVTARFKEIDRNHDGKVSLSEFRMDTSASSAGMAGPAGATHESPASAPSTSGSRY